MPSTQYRVPRVERKQLSGVPVVACFLFLSAIVMSAEDQEWYWVHAPLCAQLQVKGAKVADRPFTIYQASEERKCCTGLAVRSQGRTNRSGHFEAKDLETGHYFAVFDLKNEELIVPLDVHRWPGSQNDCGSEGVLIKRGKKTGKFSVKSFITVD